MMLMSVSKGLGSRVGVYSEVKVETGVQGISSHGSAR